MTSLIKMEMENLTGRNSLPPWNICGKCTIPTKPPGDEVGRSVVVRRLALVMVVVEKISVQDHPTRIPPALALTFAAIVFKASGCKEIDVLTPTDD